MWKSANLLIFVVAHPPAQAHPSPQALPLPPVLVLQVVVSLPPVHLLQNMSVVHSLAVHPVQVHLVLVVL